MNHPEQPIHIPGDILRDMRATPTNIAPVIAQAADEFDRQMAGVANMRNRLAVEYARQKLGMHCQPKAIAEELERAKTNLEASRLALLGLRAIEAATAAQPPIVRASSSRLVFDKPTGRMVEA